MARIVVVGAGMAGLTAALRLEQAAHDVLVLEARDRVGGRVHSVRLSNGAVVELGGEWLRTDQEHIVAMADELDVALSPVNVDFTHRDLVGQPSIPPEEHRRVAKLLSAALAELSDEQWASVSAAEFIDAVHDGSVAMDVVRSRVEGSSGVALETVGVEYLDSDYGLGDAEYVRFEDGNQALADAMADRLADVRFGHAVDAISSGGSPSVLVGDQSFTCDAVVMAAPLPVIDDIAFDPPLASDLRAVIDAMQMGTAAKIAAATVSAPPRLARHSERATAWWWTGDGADGTRSVVTGFAGGLRAIEELGTGWFDEIRRTVPEAAFTDDVVSYDWTDDPWARGCYSALGPGHDEMLDAFDVVGPLVWAGEHTRAGGSINGAIASGERAAGFVEQFLQERETVA